MRENRSHACARTEDEEDDVAASRRSGVQRTIGGPKRVLVVDDDAMLLRSVARLLAAHHITTAASVEEALRLIDEADEPFDVVLADVAMGDRGGVELHRELSARIDAPRIVFVTGGATSGYEQDYIAASGCACIMKPASRFDLLEAIEVAHARVAGAA